jgi:acyl carrier protein phosphodiesterase
MNHLCHIFLSSADPEIMFGNFIGDMIRPMEKPALSQTMQKGLELHHFIDHTVDGHPVYKEAIQLLRSSQGKYAPVVLDIFCDFLLTDHWAYFSVFSYAEFKEKIYRDLIRTNPFPADHTLYQRIHTMVDRDFLASYSHSDRIPRVFDFLKKRAHFPHRFDQALADYLQHYPSLKEKFLLVFPEMVRYAYEFIQLRSEDGATK